jgi:ferric-dicitrate binding protein FerR (iron transport regulator)
MDDHDREQAWEALVNSTRTCDSTLGWPAQARTLLLGVLVITGTLRALPCTAQEAGLRAETVVGKVKVQRPGTDGHPSAGEWLISLLVNRPRTISQGQVFQDKDGLFGEGDGATVELVCANGATLTLSGEFNAYLRLGPENKGCTVYLRGGTAVATTAPGANPNAIPAVIQYGDVTLGAISTQFGATIRTGIGNPNVEGEAFVIEGEVQVQFAATPTASRSLFTGQQLQAASSSVSRIPEAKFQLLAATYARLGAQTAPAESREVVQQELQQAYFESLSRPEDAQAQRNLKQVYQLRQLRVSPAVNYRINRINGAAIAVGPGLATPQ